ncbi:MAG: chloride channel protein [Gaiellales bacterium]
MTDPTDDERQGAAEAIDPATLLRSRSYRVLLAIAAVIGLFVSLLSWGFLELVHGIQQGVYEELPAALGFDGAPSWWPLPWLALAGALTSFAIVRLPGRGGHEPADGLATGSPARPVELPGIALAAVATLGLGLVLGPEAPLIALGAGGAVLAVRQARRDVPDRLMAVLGAAGAFAAISTIFGSPVIGAVVILEAAGLGGPTLPLVLLPGLMAAGIGSLVFTGMGSWSGLSTSAWALEPLALPAYALPDWSDLLWSAVLAVACAVVTVAIIRIARRSRSIVSRWPLVLTVGAGLVIGALAIGFAEATGEPVNAVLFSGQDAFASLVDDGPGLAMSTLVLLLVFKGLAWSVSLGSFRGGPTFPALFLGAAGGLLASHLPGLAETAAVAVCMGAACVAVLRLPLASVIIALLLTSKSGLGVAPLIILAVVVAYLTVEVLAPRDTTGKAAVSGTEP